FVLTHPTIAAYRCSPLAAAMGKTAPSADLWDCIGYKGASDAWGAKKEGSARCEKGQDSINRDRSFPQRVPTLPPVVLRAGAEKGPHAGVEVLLVEDTADNRKLISHMLRTTGASVAIAENGM